jgi:hypothetical protein
MNYDAKVYADAVYGKGELAAWFQDKPHQILKRAADDLAELQSKLDEEHKELLGSSEYILQLESRLDRYRKALEEIRDNSDEGWAYRKAERVLQEPVVERQEQKSHAGCILCDGSGWKNILVGRESKLLPCAGPCL